MRITALEISQQEFSRKINGFDTKEVREFLQMLREEFEKLLRENHRLTDEAASHRRDIERYREQEEMLKETLKVAQQMSQGISVTAQKEAEATVNEARVRAQEMINSAQLRAMELMEDIKELKRQKVSFESSLKALIDSHAKMLEITRDDPVLSQIEDKVDFLARRFEKKISSAG